MEGSPRPRPSCLEEPTKNPIEILGYSRDSRPQHLLSFSDSTTRLTSLSISHERELNITFKISPGLTHLNLNVRTPPKHVVILLSMCPNLEECVIALLGCWPPDPFTKPPVHLPKMRKLHIRSQYAASLVETLKAPVPFWRIRTARAFGQIYRGT